MDSFLAIVIVFDSMDEILIVKEGTKQEQIDKVREIFRVIENAELQLKAGESKIAKPDIEWLSFKLTHSGVSPIIQKCKE